MALEKAPIENLYDAQVTIVPVAILNSAANDDPIPLETTDKTLPGFEDAETWVISTDNPLQEIAKTIRGKLGGLTRLDFQLVYDPILLQKLIPHIKTSFDVVYTYDNAALSEVVAITAKNCQMINPASTSQSTNAGNGQQTVSFQPAGGSLFADCLVITTAARP